MFAINIENLKKTKIYIWKKTLSLSTVYSKHGHDYEKIFKEEEESTEISQILGLINIVEGYQKTCNNISTNINQEFRLKKIDEMRHYLTEEKNEIN